MTGTAHCGKTMFLTSLLWQLEEFDETRFRLRDGITLRGFQRRSVRKGEDAFPFKRFRNMLAQEYRWPEKTGDVYHYRCAFHRSDRWRIRGPQTVDFLDMPGERIADAAMVVHKDYGAWSDHMLDHLDQDPVGREVAAQFRDAAARPGAGARDVVLGYRLALARLIRAWKPLVSPSVFLLDRTGDSARDVDETGLVASRRCSLDEAREFAPLPRAVRNANPELIGEMQRHYAGYRKEVVLPLFQDLMTANSLVVLVDIPALLLAGDRRFVDERLVVISLLEAMRDDALGAWFRQGAGAPELPGARRLRRRQGRSGVAGGPSERPPAGAGQIDERARSAGALARGRLLMPGTNRAATATTDSASPDPTRATAGC